MRITLSLRKLFLKFNIVFIVCCCLLVDVGGASLGKQFSMASFEYPPFYFNKKGEVQGIAVDLTKEIFNRIGIKASFEMYQLRRALEQLKAGREDGLMILIKTPDREEYLSFTEPVTSVRGYLWCADTNKCDDIENFTFENLRPHRIGVTRGYSYGVGLDKILKKLPYVEIVNKDVQNFKKLISGRIDIFPGNEIVAKYILNNNPSIHTNIVHSQHHFMQWVLHMGISKKSPLIDYLPEINKVILKMKEEGFIEKTIKKYIE